MMVKITQDKADADATKAVVEREEAAANTKAAKTKAIADDAQRDLDEALPALDEAVKCLNLLKKVTDRSIVFRVTRPSLSQPSLSLQSDIDEVKSLKTPPGGVKLTMEVVCIMFGQKPVKKQDPNNPGKKIDDYWETAQKVVLADAKKFLQSLVDFDKDNIPDKIVQAIAPYIADENFTPQAIEKASKACTAICMWARAMNTYHFVAKNVEPKRQALKEAEAELAVTMAQLNDAKVLHVVRLRPRFSCR